MSTATPNPNATVRTRATAVLSCMIGDVATAILAAQCPVQLSDPCDILGGMPDLDGTAWRSYYDRLEAAARKAGGRPGG